MILIKKRTNLNELKTIQHHPPKGSRSYWRGISHHELVEAIRRDAREWGWTGSNIATQLSTNKQDMTGFMEVALPDLKPPAGLRHALGWYNSNSGQRPLRLYAGAVQEIGNLGVVVGEIIPPQRHTKNFDLNEVIGTAMGAFLRRMIRLPGIVKAMQNRAIEIKQADHLVSLAARKGLMPWSRVGKVHRAFATPQTWSTSDNYLSQWGLYLAFSHVAQQNPPLNQLKQLNGFYQLLTGGGR